MANGWASLQVIMTAKLRSRSAVALEIATREVVEKIRSKAPRQSGELAASVNAEGVHSSGDRFSAGIGATSQHAEWVYNGTGFYGPRHTAIVPTSSPVLIFEFEGEVVAAQSTSGQRPQKDWWDGPVAEWKAGVAAALLTLR